MILYYDNTGKLKTIIPHGDIPRQGDTNVVLDIYFDKTFYNTNYLNSNKSLYLRYKFEDDLSFGEDNIVSPISGTYRTFTEIDETERVGSLVNGTEYAVCSVTIPSISKAGKMSLVFNWKQVQNTTVLSETYLGKAEIYVEETLGLAPDVGLGMTRSEYVSLMNSLQTIVTTFNSLIGGALNIISLGNSNGDEIDLNDNLDANNHYITNVNVNAPTSDNNPTTKKYVDDIISSLQSAINTLIGTDIATFATEFEQLKTSFNTFMNSSSADDVINTLSEIQNSLTNINNRLGNMYTKAQTDAKIVEIVDNMFADISEVEF